MPAQPQPRPVKALFQRLKKVGYDEAFLRAVVLPDWWEDSLASDAPTWWQMQFRVAQRLSLPLADVLDANKPLLLGKTEAIRLKRARAGTDRTEVAPGMIAAKNAVAVVLPQLANLPVFPANLTPADFRQRILARNRTVDLAGLVEACWVHGIAVFHLSPLPILARKFAGMAYYEGNRPVIVLGSGHDAPARLAFYLAHEVGHVLRGHVKPGGGVLVDSDLESATEDQHEREADRDALAILTGGHLPTFRTFGMTAAKLRTAARGFEESEGVHSGTVALCFGQKAKRMAVAIKALQLMNMDVGGRQVIAEALRRRLFGQNPAAAIAELPGEVMELLAAFGVDCPV